METEEEFHREALWGDIDHCQWETVMDGSPKGSKGQRIVPLVNKLCNMRKKICFIIYIERNNQYYSGTEYTRLYNFNWYECFKILLR